MGAVTGDHSFLKIVTNATTRPPIAPTMIQGPATEGSSAVRTCAHTHAAGRTTKNNRNAVRFTVPSTVIAGAVGSRRTSANVFAFRAGFDVRIKAMAPRSFGCSAPSPEAPDVVVQHQELLEHRHALAFAAELGEQLAQPPATRDVKTERLGEILLRVRRGVRGDVVRQGGGDTATLKVDPLRVGHAVRLAYLPEGPPESPGPGERPIVIEEGVPQLVQNQSGQHVPRDLVAPPPLAGHVAALDLDDLGGPVRHTGNAGAQEHAVVPILEAADDQQLPRPPQRLADQIAPGGVFAAPRADVHPIVHALVAVRADVLELLVAPFLRAPAPGARPHRVHHAAAAAPLAAPVILEPLGGLERLRARVPVGDVATAPGAVREAVRHHPTAVVTLRAGLLGGVAPLEPATAVRAIRPKPLHFGRAGGTAQLGRRGLALTVSHVSVPRPRSAG